MQLKTSTILISVFLGSLILSALAVALDPVINNDAIWYLSVAKLFAQGEYSHAIRADVFYEWPFYAFTIGSLSCITGLPVDTAAYILNALFIAIAVTTFVAIAYELGHKDRRITLLAAMVFLLLPALNDYRSFVIRDFGYLACYAIGLYALLKYANTNHYRYALIWGIVMIFAVLFRSEGVVFLLLAPFYLLLQGVPFSRTNWQMYLKSNSVLLLALLIAGVVAGYVALAYEDVQLSGLIVKHVDKALLVFTSANELLGQYADKLRAALLFHHGSGTLKFIALIIVLAILISEFIMSLTVPYFVLWLVALRNRWFAALPTGFGLWKTFVWLNIALLSVFVFASLFLVTRYTLAFLLTFMLSMPFFLMYFYSEIWKQKINSLGRAGIVFLCVLFVYNVLDSFVSTGASRDYQKQAGLWLKQQMQPGDRLFSSVTTVAYYADRIDLLQYKDNPRRALGEVRNYSLKEVKRVLKRPRPDKYAYLALRFRPRKNEVIGNIGSINQLQRLKVFENNKGDQIVIYKIKS
jgi:hypothetical protein